MLDVERKKTNPAVHTTRVGPSRMQIRRHSGEAVFPYLDRTNTTLDWHWINNPIAQQVAILVQPLYDLVFSHITRVSIQIHSHERDIPPHWDDGGFREDKWPPHHHGWVVRIPLTTTDASANISDLLSSPFYAIIGGRKINLSADNHAFAYDERWILHGGEYREHMRGMIGIYGIPKEGLIWPLIPMRITKEVPIYRSSFWGNAQQLYDDMYKRCTDLFGKYADYLLFALGEDIFAEVMEIHRRRYGA
jgi:hypothetical protein